MSTDRVGGSGIVRRHKSSHAVGGSDALTPADIGAAAVGDVVSNSLVTSTGLAFAAGSASAPSVAANGDTDTGLYFPAANTVGVTTGGTERARVDSGGAVLVGDTTKRTYIHLNTSPMLQVNGTTNDTASIGVARYSASTAGAILNLFKSRSATVGTQTTVTTGDTLGIITWSGVDTGNVGRRGAIIEAVSEGTIGAGIVPARLGFYTADDAGTNTERLRIDRAGLITGSGTSLGAWTAYTPTLTNATLGNGTAEGYWARIGRMVHVFVTITFGSTTAFATSGNNFIISLPVSSANRGTHGIAELVDVSTGVRISGAVQRTAGTEVTLRYGKVGSTVVEMTACNVDALPFTAQVNDLIQFAITYEAA